VLVCRVTSVSSASASRSFCLNPVLTGLSTASLAFMARSCSLARILSASSVVCVLAFVEPRTERSRGPSCSIDASMVRRFWTGFPSWSSWRLAGARATAALGSLYTLLAFDCLTYSKIINCCKRVCKEPSNP
jgi:hypothetical protein